MTSKREARKNRQEYQEWLDAADLLSHRATATEHAWTDGAPFYVSLDEEERIFGSRVACKAAMMQFVIIRVMPDWAEHNLFALAECLLRAELDFWADLAGSGIPEGAV